MKFKNPYTGEQLETGDRVVVNYLEGGKVGILKSGVYEAWDCLAGSSYKALVEMEKNGEKKEVSVWLQIINKIPV